MQVDKDKSKHRSRAAMTRSKSRQSLNNIPVPPDDKGGLKVKEKPSLCLDKYIIMYYIFAIYFPIFIIKYWKKKPNMLYVLCSSPGGVECQIGSGAWSWLTPWDTASPPIAWPHSLMMRTLLWILRWRPIRSLLRCPTARWDLHPRSEEVMSAQSGPWRLKIQVSRSSKMIWKPELKMFCVYCIYILKIYTVY